MGLLDQVYVQLFSHKYLRRTNEKLLKLALKVRGFNNFESHKSSGEQHFVEQVLKRAAPKVYVDVGANVGRFARTSLEATPSIVYAFEPLAEPYRVLAQGVHSNENCRLTLRHIWRRILHTH